MPIEVRRFGAGNRRREGPPGTSGVTGQVIHSDARGVISELAFAPGGRIAPHDNPNTTWFCVIEGGGFVQVGDEQQRVAPGEAILWPASVSHGAWTERTPMRVILVELAGADDAHLRGILDGLSRRLLPGETSGVSRGEGQLTPRPDRPPSDPEGEPA
ncbi:MAG TPA: cupin domain-containing protein [Candidatus Limnocylindrales bacterium]|nr:cupin domain-containing protein [Candidatus Limnocylindrales bacterium]